MFTIIDFSKAFDVAKHAILLSKLSAFDLPPPILNWIIAFLTDRAQVSKTPDGQFSIMHPITRSIIQGSGIGPTLWLVMASDLRCISDINLLFKYADDTTSWCQKILMLIWLLNLVIYKGWLIVTVWLLTFTRPRK